MWIVVQPCQADRVIETWVGMSIRGKHTAESPDRASPIGSLDAARFKFRDWPAAFLLPSPVLGGVNGSVVAVVVDLLFLISKRSSRDPGRGIYLTGPEE